MTNDDLSEPRTSGLASGWTVQPEAATPPAIAEAATDAELVESDDQRLSNVAVMMLGVLGGLYLLYTWGWFEIARVNAAANAVAAGTSGILGNVLQQIVFWFTPAAPALWFLTTYTFARHRGTLTMLLLLLLGVVVLLPIPLLVSGGAA